MSSQCAVAGGYSALRLVCALLLSPYFVVLFLSINAPRCPLPIPRWARKKLRKADGPLGREISPDLRLLSPHHWPHPVWAVPILAFAPVLWGSVAGRVVLAAELLVLPCLLALEKHKYLAQIGEDPASGFKPPDPPGIVHGLRSCLYGMYLQHVVRADMLDFSPLLRATASQQAAGRHGCFLPQEFPPRRRGGERPVVIRGLPQRQCTMTLPETLEQLRERRLLHGFAASHHPPRISCRLSENEGAGAMGLYCSDCPFLGTEFAHEHSVDGSWHAVLSPADALQVCEAGWAERGPPIVCRNCCQHFEFAPEGWCFLYAPTTPSDVEVLRKILEASYDFVVSQGSTSKSKSK